MLLYAVAVLDELAAGVPTAGAPGLEADFALSHAGTTFVVFVVPGAVALVVEPVIFLVADRYPRRWFIIGGLGVMALASAGAAIAPSWPILALALAAWACATGTASAISQATLVDAFPEQRARTMTRWTLGATAGDLGGPLLLAGLAALDLGWRGAFAVVAIVLGIHAILIARRPLPEAPRPPDDPEAAEPSLWHAFRAALRDRVLILWLFGLALCDLLDEILVVLTSLHLRAAGVDQAWQSAILVGFVLGGAAGLVILDRLLAARRDERRLLIAVALACVVAYLGFLASSNLYVRCAAAVAVGATSAPLYPLVAARAYQRYPGRSGLVLAASHLFTPLGLALPLVLGALADHAGTFAALAVLVVQPLGLAVLARFTR